VSVASIAIPPVERVTPVRFVDHAPVYAEVAEWATSPSGLGMDPDQLPAVEAPPEWVTTSDSPTVRASAPVPREERTQVVVVADPIRPGQWVAHRAGRFSDDPAACGAGHGYLADANEYEDRWCQDPACTGFTWFGGAS
jgi:hypothetical protein